MKKNNKNLTSLLSIVLVALFSFNALAIDANNTSDLLAPSNKPQPVILGTNNLSTLFAANNGGDSGGGIYFELENVGSEAIVINSWDVNTENQTTVNVWTRPGTYVGFETTTAGWTLLGTDNSVVAQGVDTPTSVAVGGLIIQPGEVYGIAMEGDGSWIYTNGDGTNQVYNNGVLELRAGSANNIAFNSGVFSPRVWNGVVYYGPAGPPPVMPSLSFWGMMLLALTLVAFSYSRFYRNN